MSLSSLTRTWAFVARSLFASPPGPVGSAAETETPADGLAGPRSQEVYHVGIQHVPQTGPANCNVAVGRCFAASAKQLFPEICGAKETAKLCRLPREYRGENIIPLFKLAPTSWARLFVRKGGELVEDRASAIRALEYIRDSLRCHLPVQMAVSYLHRKGHQQDGATNHHVIVYQWREKADGTIVLKALDPATKNADKAEIEFVVDRQSLRIEKKPDAKGQRINRDNPRHYLGTFVVRAPVTELACKNLEEAPFGLKDVAGGSSK